MTRFPSLRGRGAATRPHPRWLAEAREPFDDGWTAADPEVPPLPTRVTVERSRSIVSRNESPDIPFSASINPYRGCEHGCVYCYARPTHAYVDLSPGLDFESRLYAKVDAAALLRRTFDHPAYRPEVIALGASTDPYQPIERRHCITREILGVMLEYRHPVTIVTKSGLVERDLDLLGALADLGLVEVHVSVTSLDRHLARRLEPRAPAPERRLGALARLAAAGVPTGVMYAPCIPGLNDTELEAVLEAAAEAGVRRAGYVMLRLPHEVRLLFEDWLARHAPLAAGRVLALMRDVRGGRMNDPRFGSRLTGEGAVAALIARRFAAAARRLGLARDAPPLPVHLFRRPERPGTQLGLGFDDAPVS